MRLSDFLNPIGGFLLRHWVWFALAGALFATKHFMDKAADLKAANALIEQRAESAEKLAGVWESHAKTVADLAEKTAQARAAERQAIMIIRDAAGTAKGEIANAPGADDRFVYSDPAYRFMRGQSAPDPAGAAEAAPGVGPR